MNQDLDLQTFSRRGVLGMGAGVTAAFSLQATVPAHPSLADPARLSYLHAAEEAARWIASAEQNTKEGIYWFPEPDHPEKLKTESSQLGLYSGSSGIILFLLELARVSGKAEYLQKAARGADYLASRWKEDTPKTGSSAEARLSFMTGQSGIPFALVETWKATGERRYRDAAIEATQYVVGSALPASGGVTWTNSSSVFSGDSAIILYLLYAANALQDDRYRQLAVKGGYWLLGNADPDSRGGLRWNAWKGKPVSAAYRLPPNPYFPNFEAGSPGPALALGRLYSEVKNERFLEAARGGILHVQRLATVRNDAALVHYREPDLTNLYYLGLCHGPAGTARPFYELYKNTKEADYLVWLKRFARGISDSGFPEEQTPGLWNVVCQCCGSAAVIELFLGIWAATGQREYLTFAQRVGDQLVSRGTDIDGKGLRWYQAWTRVQPGVTTAETGYMIGAAGVGSALLHLHSAVENKYQPLLLPINPFPAKARV